MTPPDRLKLLRLHRWFRARRRKWLATFLEGAAVLGALLVFASAGLFLVERASDKWFWRDGEYNRLTSLRAGFDLRYFEDQLGPPFTSHEQGGFRESGFKGRDYWVQTISRSGTVEVYAVTSCDKSFHPAFTVAGTDLEIELNRDHLAEVIPGANIPFNYAIGASAPTLFYEGFYGGTPGFYKTTIWGFNSLCRFPENVKVRPGGRPSGYTSSLGSDGLAFRRQVVVNTFAESAPEIDGGQPSNFGVDIRDARQSGKRSVGLTQFGDFYVGPHRVLLQGADR